jgi:hypothetical protein
MRRVQQASIAPFRCAVIPFMGNQSASGFIDTGMDLIGVDPHVYVSFEGAVEIAKEIGWVGPSVVKAVEDEVAFSRPATSNSKPSSQRRTGTSTRSTSSRPAR